MIELSMNETWCWDMFFRIHFGKVELICFQFILVLNHLEK